MKTKKFSKAVVTVIDVLLIAAALSAVIKTLFTGFDIDEAYAIAQSYRMCLGDFMFMDMWEPHQMSAFGGAIFIYPFLLFTGGKTAGIVFYLRVMSTIIHLLLGVWLFITFRKKCGNHWALLVSLVHVCFLPKWVMTFEFELMQYWSVCILLISFWNYLSLKTGRDKEKNGKFFRFEKCDIYLFIGSVALFISMMTYPTMFLLYPCYIAAIFVCMDRPVKEKIRASVFFTILALLIGIGFLVILAMKMSPSEFIKYVKYIFMDESHSMPLITKFGGYWKELESLAKLLVKRVPIAAIVAAVITTLKKVLKKNKVHRAELNELFFMTLIVSLVEIVIIHQFRGQILEDKNQFFMYFRFLFITVVGIGLSVYTYGKNKIFLYIGMIPAIVSTLASSIVTNMTLEIACARCFIGVLATVIVLAVFAKEECTEKITIITSNILAVSIVLSLILCKLGLLRVTGCMPVTVMAPMSKVSTGPLKGIYVTSDYASMYNDNFSVLEKELKEDEKVLFFSAENIYYLSAPVEIATPSVQGTAVFNDMYFYYYDEHQEKIPDKVVIDKAYESNFVYNYSEQNKTVLQFIEEEYGNVIFENDRLIICSK